MSDFDPAALGDRPAAAGAATVADPAQESNSPNSFGDKPSASTAPDPMAHWRNLYSGLEGIDDRLSPAQRAGVEQLSRVSDKPEEIRAEAVNQAFIKDRIGMNGPVIDQNWGAVKSAFVKKEFGLDLKDVNDTQLYGLIKNRIGAQSPEEMEAQGSIKPWTWADSFADDQRRVGRSLANFWESINHSPLKLPDPPPDLPDIVVSGTYPISPAVAAGVYKGVKPLLEGFVSPLGIATLGAGGALAPLAKASPLARGALRSMSGIFGALMGYSTVKAAPETLRTLRDPKASTQDKVGAVVENVTSAAASVAGALHAAFGEVPERAPAIAKAIEEKTPTEAASVLRKEAVTAGPDAADALNRAATQLEEVGAYEGGPEQWEVAGLEKIKAAAVQTADGSVTEGEDHESIRREITVEKLDAVPIKEGETVKLVEGEPVVTPLPDGAKEGFVTTAGRFVDRVEARQIAEQADQIVSREPAVDAQGNTSPPEDLHSHQVRFARPRSTFGETSLKNATAELERVAYGFDEAPAVEQRDMTERWVRSGEVLEKDPKAGERLASQLKSNPNLGLSDDQSALLLRHKVALETAVNAAAEVATDPGATAEAKKVAQQQLAQSSQELHDLLDAIHRRGTEWGREGRWRQALAREDYSFASQQRLLSAAKGRPLTIEETDALQKRVRELEAKQRELDMAIAKQRIAPTRAAERRTPLIPPKARAALSSAADEARKRLSVRLAQLGGARFAVDPGLKGGRAIPLEIAQDLAVIAADHLARFAEDGAAAAESMARELGEWVKPHLEAAIKAGRDVLNKTARPAQTETPTFKAWFGKSKVVDENGQPKVMYHGSPHGKFDAFDPGRRGTGADIKGLGDFGNGIYFTPDREMAESYAGNRLAGNSPFVAEVYLKIENPFTFEKLFKFESGLNDLIRARGNIFKVADEEIDALQKNLGTSESELDFIRNIQDEMQDNWKDTDFAKILKKRGYDGVISPDGKEYVVFSPTQIKSATNNTGAFDPKSVDTTDAKSAPFTDRVLSDPRATNPPKSVWLSDAGRQALDRLNQRVMRGLVKYAVDPGKIDGDVLSDLATVGGDLIYSTGVNFAKWSARMVAELGEQVRPHLETIWGRAKDVYRATVVSNLEVGADANGPANLPRVALQLARGFIEDGMRDRDQVVAAVHDVVSNDDPKITRRDVADAISGYGKFKPLSKDQIDAQLRDIKGQLLQVSKLEDMAAGKAPKKTGPERGIPSDDQRYLIKQVEEKKKEGGYTVTDPEKQLRTTLQAAERRIENEIADVDRQIRTNEPFEPTKKPAPSSPKIEEMKARLGELRQQREYARQALQPGADIATLAERQAKSLDRQIAEIERQLKTGEIFPKGRADTERVDDPSVRLREKRLAELKEERDYLRDSIQPEPLPATPEERSLSALKKRMTTQIADLEKQIATGEKIVKEKRTVALDSEAAALKARRDALREQFDAVFGKRELTDQQRVNIFKAYAKRRIEELQTRIAEKDFEPKEKRPPPPLDEEAIKIKQELERMKQDFAIERAKAEEEAKPAWQKAMRTTTDLARASALSGYHVFGKLASFSLWRFGEKPVTEILGAVIRQVPGLDEIAEKANVESGAEFESLGKFYTQAATRGMKDAAETLQTGKSGLKAELGEHRLNVTPVRWYDYFGIGHMAVKAPLLRGAFELHLEKATQAAIAAGVDVTDPMVQGALRQQSFTYAERTILQEKNVISDMINAGMRVLEKADPDGDVNKGKVILSTLIKTFVTKGIVRVPANYVLQTLERSPLGLTKGATQAVWANVAEQAKTRGWRWAENMPGVSGMSEAEANTIIRLFKVGGVGTAVFVWGMIDATKAPKDRMFGGYYQPGDKRGQDDVPWGQMRIGNVTIPHLLTHNPMTEVGQMGSTMMRVALSRISKKDANQKGYLAGAMASLLAVASESPVVNPITQTATKIERGQASSVLDEELAGLVPQLVQNAAQDIDGKSRKATGLKETLELTVPVLRENVPETKAQKKRDIQQRLKK